VKTTFQAPLATYRLQDIFSERLLTYRQLAHEYGIELEVIDDLASLITVAGDAQVQRNLLDIILPNTILYSRATRITFSTRQLLQSGNDLLLEFSLIDNGEFPPRRHEKLRYFRALVQAKRLIENLGGKAEIITVPGLNTTLKFLLRYQWAPVEGEGGEGVSMGLRGRRILVAEDNEVNQQVIRRILSAQGVDVVVTANGKEAVETLERERDAFDLVLMDLQMPHMDGLEATQYIRRQLQHTVPIIALTTSSAQDLYTRCIEAGMNHFVQKPFAPEELVRAISSLLQGMEMSCSA
jgi:CheY-like chemotaxis protein